MSIKPEQAFLQGFGIAIADIIRSADQHSLALNLMDNSGITLADLREGKLNSFDLDPIAAAWKAARREDSK